MGRRREEALQKEAAVLIQHCWRLYRQRQEEVAEQNRKSNHLGLVKMPSMVSFKDAPTTEELFPEEARDALLDEYRRLLLEREALLGRSLSYQRILGKHFSEQRERKGDDDLAPLTTPEAEQQYWTLLRQVMEERRRVAHKRESSDMDIDALHQQHQSTIDDAVMQEHNFQQFIKETCTNAAFTRSHHGIPPEVVQRYIDSEQQQRARIQASRVRYIQLKNNEKRLRHTATDNDQGNNGMFLIDFEQLKIENTNLNEKIEERNEDLVKLRRKVTTTIHVLTHVKEKLEYMKDENAQLRTQVSTTEGELNGVRDQLAQTKRKRDGYVKASIRIKEKMPLVGSEDLLMDYEKRKRTINDSRIEVVRLTEQHTQLMDLIRNQRPKISSLRDQLSHYPA